MSGTQPSPEHIDAVARAMEQNHHPYGVGTPESDGRARLLLTSANPTVHAAMLDALVRAGVLRRELSAVCDDIERTVGPVERRLVTAWEQA